jgi:hypothetical protein
MPLSVNDDQEIDSLLIYVSVDLINGTCTGLYLYKTTSTEHAIINEDGTFEVEVNGIQIGFEESAISISGKFNSNRSCDGEFDGADVSVIICGGYLTIGTGMEIDPFTWSATKQ